METNLESRVATLEERARAQGELNHQLGAKLDLVLAAVGRMETSIAVAGSKACPAPGKCLELAETNAQVWGKVRTLGERIDALETTAAEARGGWKAILWIASFAAAIGSLLGWMVEHFASKGHP